MTGNSNDETNFPHKLLLNNRHVTNLRKTLTTHQLIFSIRINSSSIAADGGIYKKSLKLWNSNTNNI